MKKKIAVVLAVLAVCTAFMACGGNEYAGTYKTVFTDAMGRSSISLILNKNGKCRIFRLGEGETEEMLIDGPSLLTGKYSVKDSTITLTLTYADPVSSAEITDEYTGTVLSNGNIRLEIFARNNLLIKQKD